MYLRQGGIGVGRQVGSCAGAARCGPAMLCAGALPDMASGCLVTTILKNGADGVNRLSQEAYTSENGAAGKTENRSSEAFFP